MNKNKKQLIAALVFLLIAGVAFFAVSRTPERPYIFENAPVESITLFNSLTGESATYFDKTDAPEIKALMSHLAKLRQGRKIPQPAPGSTELSIRVVYQDGRTVKCGNDSFSSEGKTYQVLVTSEAANRPALSAWSWEAMWEAYCPKATWDHGFDDDYVLSTMYTIQADSIRNPDDLGENVTAQALADALKIAALNPLTEEEAAAFRAGKADLYCWWIWSVYLEGGPDSFAPDDARLLISCGFPQNIVIVELRKSEQSGTVIVKDPALYQLVRHSNDYEETIDVAAYQQYCEILEPQMETTFEAMNRNGEYSGYILTRFAKAYTYDAPDGRGSVELYYFDYALLLEDAECFTSYAGGMYLDSAERIQGFNGGGMLAVCLQNGSTIYTEFMGNDFWFDGKNIEHSEVRKHVDTRLADLLDCALQANQK